MAVPILTDTEGNEELIFPDDDGTCKSRHDPLGNKSHALIARNLRQEGNEFISPGTRHGILIPHEFFQTIGHRNQHFVPDVMSETVVDILEPVEVQHHDAEGPFFSLRLGQDHNCMVIEKGPVGQAGEEVMIGHPFQVLIFRVIPRKPVGRPWASLISDTIRLVFGCLRHSLTRQTGIGKSTAADRS
jgi:hypothetical protein